MSSSARPSSKSRRSTFSRIGSSVCSARTAIEHSSHRPTVAPQARRVCCFFETTRTSERSGHSSRDAARALALIATTGGAFLQATSREHPGTTRCCSAARRKGVGVPSRRSVSGTLPVSMVSPEQVENVVGDLERDAEQSPVLAVAAPEHARGLEELPRLQRAPLEVERRLVVVEIVLLLPAAELPAREGE